MHITTTLLDSILEAAEADYGDAVMFRSEASSHLNDFPWNTEEYTLSLNALAKADYECARLKSLVQVLIELRPVVAES